MTKKNNRIPEQYVVRVRKADVIVDSIMMALTLLIALYVIILFMQTPKDLDHWGQFVAMIICIPLLLFLGAWHYPRYVFNSISVHGEEITFSKIYFRKHVVQFKDIREIYRDGRKDDHTLASSNGSHAVVIDYGKGKYRLPCDFCDDWSILKADLKKHGIAVK